MILKKNLNVNKIDKEVQISIFKTILQIFSHAELRPTNGLQLDKSSAKFPRQ